MKLTVTQLSIAYRSTAQTVRPVHGFDLTVEAGELLLLHGPSGCGKTTMLSALAGLLTPESGSIQLDDDNVAELRGRAMLRHRRTRVGMVFQSFNLIPSLTAAENVAVPLTLAGVSRREAASRARELLREFDMDERRGHRPGALSGGQQQRVAIARALAPNPPLLLADEPTAHLDHDQVDNVAAIFRKIADRGRIVIISTHDARLDVVADRIVRMGTSGSVATAAAPRLVDASRDLVGRAQVHTASSMAGASSRR